MLREGLDPNVADEHGMTPWRAALENKQDKMCAMLIEFGAKFDQDDFFVAVYNDQEEVVKAMVGKGQVVNVVDEEGTSPLMIAIQEEHGRIARLLRTKGAKLPTDPGYKKGPGPAPAPSSPKVETKTTERSAPPPPPRSPTNKAPASPTHKSPSSPTEKAPPKPANFDPKDIFDAVSEGNLKAVKNMIAWGVDVRMTDADGTTLVELATIKDHVAIADLLVKHGAAPA